MISYVVTHTPQHFSVLLSAPQMGTIRLFSTVFVDTGDTHVLLLAWLSCIWFSLLVICRHSLCVRFITNLKSNLGLRTDFTRQETTENYKTNWKVQDMNVYQTSVFLIGTHWLVIAKYQTILHLQDQYRGQSRSPESTLVPYLR